MTARATVAAVDLGASSGRIVVGRFGPGAATVETVHRFPNQPVRVRGVLHWDVLALFRGILDGLRRAEAKAGPLDSIGVDTWAVDYGLLDSRGDLLGNPVHYRDGRTAAVASQVLDSVGADTLYQATGIQHQPFNTVFQLLAEQENDATRVAAHALLIPDLINFWLCGVRGTELTNASTTALLDSRTQTWSASLANSLGVHTHWFPPIHRPGTILGPALPAACADAGLSGSPLVIAVPSHDTAAAIAGIPASTERFAYVSAGTWALVGVELRRPVITEDARRANFTNELGADATVRFLRNVTGFWLLQECLRHWEVGGDQVDLDVLTQNARDVPGLRTLIEVQDPQFVDPGNMPARIAAASLRTSSVIARTRAEITRCILDSMAVAIRHAVRDAIRLSDLPVDVIHIVGGGVVNRMFCQLIADACQLPVLAGPTEATSWGNATSQAQALGVIPPSLAHARAVVRDAEKPVAYLPQGDETDWLKADDVLARARS
jgi:rhamnulokinase